MRQILTILFLLLLGTPMARAQVPRYSKMSAMVRRAVHEQRHSLRRQAPSRRSQPELCAFVRVTSDGDDVLRRHDARVLAQFGDIYIASIPLSRVAGLSACREVTRIEASEPCGLTNDTSALVLGVGRLHEGVAPLQQAFTGRGVVIGVEDIGFDVTHPTFYSRDLTEYRVKRFWDQLATDSVGSPLYVGREFRTAEEILGYAHSRDGVKVSHGTHTSGTAAGSGYNSPYAGMAPESDLCLVSNLVSNYVYLVDSLDRYKYTSATDVLGFKYAFDYADSLGMPCVVSFSEGSYQDFHGDDTLIYEVLSQLTGPGHIVVASAGNRGLVYGHMEKMPGQASCGSFVFYDKPYVYFSMLGDKPFSLKVKAYYDTAQPDSFSVDLGPIIELPDSEYVDTLMVNDRQWVVDVVAYPSCYDSTQTAYEAVIVSPMRYAGMDKPISLELVGEEAHAELFCLSSFLEPNAKVDSTLNACERRYNVMSPGSAPDVICVGATSYRTQIVNYKGQVRVNDKGTGGVIGNYSSQGPTFDRRTKPDVVAPGTNVVSSYSSYYLENNPTAADTNWGVEHFDFRGRTYAWNADTGTSMATPMVAGIIALWLQANPRLTPDDVKAVFSRTCRHYDDTLDYPNNIYGHGEIDPYAGLLDVLGFSAIQQVSAAPPRGVGFQLSGRTLSLTFDSAPTRAAGLSLFSIDGRQVFHTLLPAGDATPAVNLPALPGGVYAVQVDGQAPGQRGSTLIRL